ncbi:hypothetical protein LF1_44860 [Rubripirellula obstinata]|uniref:Uncharacterized protein n=1 Tax=Rubripirellula obstinata TaxID=406547 RepID=A0A5B1CPP5_9BACT|nr:hypothetical protein [Rubripirellula obstinata]KAA1261925.1 hypothetical protein LF1_44860 [Rubripirellula obstinata]
MRLDQTQTIPNPKPKSASNPLWCVAIATCIAAAVCQTGCLGVASQVMRVAGMNLIPAEYEGLNKSTVAIVTMTDSSQYTNDSAARDLSRRVGAELTTEGKDITLIREDLVQQYRDVHGYESNDFVEIGKEVKADKVLVIEMTDLSLRDGATLFQGSADIHLQVVDVATGESVYTQNIDQYTFPKSTGQHTSETTEKRFTKLYLTMLSKEIGRKFRAWDPTETVAQDVLIASQ